MWWIAAAVLLPLGVMCGVTLGIKVTRGEARPWSPGVLFWAIGWHALAGGAALWMITRAVA